MILIFKKGESKEISENFNINEFHCQCDFKACYSTQLSIRFIASAQSARLDFGKRIIVTSGNRCQLRNKELKEQFGNDAVSDKSSHMIGDAGDFTCENRADLDDLECALKKHFKYTKRYKSHIHADTRLLK